MNKKLFIVFALLATFQGIQAADCTAASGASPCSGSTPYCDLSLAAGSRVCVAAASCSSSVPYGDPTTKTCVAATSCDTANPYGDPNASPKICVVATSCNSAAPYGDPTTKTCVVAASCASGNPYADPTTKTCVATTGCATANPYSDANASPKTCVVATGCNSAAPLADPTAKTCVVAASCNSANPYADTTAKLCVASGACSTANTFTDASASPKACVVATSCNSANQYGDLNTKTCVAACPTGSTADATAKTCPLVAVTPTTSSPSSAFNVTPVAVYTKDDTTAPAFSAVATATTVFGPGFDSTTAYVWLVDKPAVTATGTYAVNRRTINTTAFSKSNSSADTAITTSIAGTATILTAVAPGYLGIASYVAGTNWNTATATASEISITYIAGNGSATTKAITGNTNTGVYFKLLDHFYLNGTFYVVYAMNTHTVGTATVADSWVYNGIYIHGVVVSTGALLNYTTGGVKMLALTQTNNGATTCVANTNTGCATAPSSSLVSSFKVGVQNFTQKADTVSYLWSDQSTTNAYTIKLGSINVTTGAATSGTTLTTTAAATGTDPVVSTTYSIAGFHGSDSGSYGAYINKLITSTTAAGVATYTPTILSFINGTSTAQTTLYSLTPTTGYQSVSVQGFGTPDGFILLNVGYSTATTVPAQPYAAQAQRFYTNGTAVQSSAVSLGTFSAAPSAYQDTNGTIVFGYTLSDANTGNTYSGYMGSYVVQAMAASSLTSIIALLSLMIVALFAF